MVLVVLKTSKILQLLMSRVATVMVMSVWEVFIMTGVTFQRRGAISVIFWIVISTRPRQPVSAFSLRGWKSSLTTAAFLRWATWVMRGRSPTTRLSTHGTAMLGLTTRGRAAHTIGFRCYSGEELSMRLHLGGLIFHRLQSPSGAIYRNELWDILFIWWDIFEKWSNVKHLELRYHSMDVLYPWIE